MKAYLSLFALLVGATALTTACNEDATSLGSDIMPEADKVFTEQLTVKVPTQTVKTGAIAARTNNSLLGSVIDPVTNIRTTNGFVSQFFIPEVTPFPTLDKMVKDDQGNVVVDSCSLTFWHVNYFGDSLATMKVTAQEIDSEKTPNGSTTYYTNLNPEEWLKQGGEQQTASYSIFDQTQPKAQVENKKNYRYFNIRLSKEFGQRILNAYYKTPEHFKDSYAFAHHVLGGFYMKHAGGLGTMVQADHLALNLYYRYHPDFKNKPDSIISDVQVFTSTDEVIQTSRIENEIPSSLLDNTQDFTYIKAPTALHTEATLPIDDIIAGTHYNDSINNARLYLRTIAEDASLQKLQEAPPYLVMMRVADFENFFQKNHLPDGRTSFAAVLDNKGSKTQKATHSYPFTNIAPLITIMRNERNAGAGVTATDSEATRKAKWAAWEQKNPNWNRVAIVPATPVFTTTTNPMTRQTVKNLVRLNYAFGLYGVRLAGGKNNGVDLSVIYSRFNN